jgi:hypothetical protein
MSECQTTEKIHKLSWFSDKKRKTMAMLCRPSESGSSTDTKSVDWNNVTCARCLVFKKNENYFTDMRKEPLG